MVLSTLLLDLALGVGAVRVPGGHPPNSRDNANQWDGRNNANQWNGRNNDNQRGNNYNGNNNGNFNGKNYNRPQANAVQHPAEVVNNNPHEEIDAGCYQVPHFAACILGRSQAPRSNRHIKLMAREVNDALRRAEAGKPLRWSHHAIKFNKGDHPSSTSKVALLPLVCTPTISNIAVSRTLIDGGACLNIFSIDMFDKMQVPPEHLMPTRPFTGVTAGTTTPIGQVLLPVAFGTRNNYHTELIEFDVAHMELP